MRCNQQAGGVLFAVGGIDRDQRHWSGHSGCGHRGPVHCPWHRRVSPPQGGRPAPELSEHRVNDTSLAINWTSVSSTSRRYTRYQRI